MKWTLGAKIYQAIALVGRFAIALQKHSEDRETGHLHKGPRRSCRLDWKRGTDILPCDRETWITAAAPAAELLLTMGDLGRYLGERSGLQRSRAPTRAPPVWLRPQRDYSASRSSFFLPAVVPHGHPIAKKQVGEHDNDKSSGSQRPDYGEHGETIKRRLKARITLKGFRGKTDMYRRRPDGDADGRAGQQRGIVMEE
ncbi:hypothetical protein CSOJ01_11883 [Colletotrichum sojae]|uniref:Uncharacterized protein n=1 Tax=Colletotrichum sojae TaxID=2175907 RepID=A0A8H6IX39_9PEZI|nr:hypothetical protein CSOJ01_11883 [Colletotrichum sojae]